MMKIGDIRFDKVRKDYGKVTALSELNLDIAAGERLVLLGPSGCGKTTALRIIAGLESITAGELYLGGQLANDLEPGERSVAMVFQNYALYPHMTIWDNIAFGLETKGVPAPEITARIQMALEMVNLAGLESRRPRELSGGQRQRVALARAVVKQAPYFLLDEPLSNLDSQLRAHARTELVRLHEQIASTMVYVTHDQVEAMTIGQRVAVMAKGVLQQIAPPDIIYNRPVNTFVARFIGNPMINLFQASVESGVLRLTPDTVLELPPVWRTILAAKNATQVLFGIRPEHVNLSPDSRNNGIPAMITMREELGSMRIAYLKLAGLELTAVAGGSQLFPADNSVYWDIDWDQVHFFDEASGISLGYPE